jgi:hypothetical protein
MTDLLRDLQASLTSVTSDWAKYSVVGGFLFYAFGYLAVRSHVTAIGIGTDLAAFDDRYVFAGAHFLVYVASAVANILFVVSLLIVLPVALVLWGVSKVRPGSTSAWRTLADRRPLRVTLVGIAQAMVAIQFVMRQCFYLNNLLLAPALPPYPAWLAALLLDDRWMALYFGALVLMCAISLAILLATRRVDARGSLAVARPIFVVLIVVQIMLLPINYGILIMDKVFPRVAGVEGTPLASGESAWLVWEGKDGVTYLVRRANQERVLLTVPRGAVMRTEIVDFDPIIPTLFGHR